VTVTKDEQTVQETIRLSIQQRNLASYMQMDYPSSDDSKKDNECDVKGMKEG